MTSDARIPTKSAALLGAVEGNRRPTRWIIDASGSANRRVMYDFFAAPVEPTPAPPAAVTDTGRHVSRRTRKP